jgi:Protein of unknown function (DUF3500)
MSGFDRRKLLQGTAATAAMLALGPQLRAEPAGSAREAMARSALAFLAALEPGSRAEAVFAFGDDERRNWHYVPRGRKGVPFKRMSAKARRAAHELMQASLSSAGYAKAMHVFEVEEVLGGLEGSASFRDPENYYVTLFGEPGPQAPWGWRLEGHHLSLNFTLLPGQPAAVTPTFFGANPAEVRSGPKRGLRTLAHEQDLGLSLARSVDEKLRTRMLIAAQAPSDLVTGPGREDSLKSFAGVPLGDLPPSTRTTAQRLIEVYAGNLQSELVEAELRKLQESGLERVHFAWAGPIDPSRGHYYRLHGPTLLLEYDNTQNNANHIHTVWHRPGNAFGADELRAHYEHGHRHV